MPKTPTLPPSLRLDPRTEARVEELADIIAGLLDNGARQVRAETLVDEFRYPRPLVERLFVAANERAVNRQLAEPSRHLWLDAPEAGR